MVESKANADANENISQQSALEQQWFDCCQMLAEAIVPEDIAGPPSDPLNRLRWQGLTHGLAMELASDELVDLVCQGFKQLADNPTEKSQRFLSQLETQMELFAIPTETQMSQDLASQLQIDAESLSFLQKSALQDMAEAKIASPVFSIIAFLQSQRPEAWFHLAMSLYQEERYRLACNVISSARLLRPQPEYSLLLAACHDMLGESDKVVEALNDMDKLLADYQLTLSQDWEIMRKQLRDSSKQ